MYTIKEQRKAHQSSRILKELRPRIERDLMKIQRDELRSAIEKYDMINNLEDLFFKMDFPKELILVFEPYKKCLQTQREILNHISVSLDLLLNQYAEELERKSNE